MCISSRLDHQPDLYCIYKFYDFADHDSITIPSSNNPNFDDRAQYPVQMDADLDRYLKQSQLTIFVFDDRDQKDDRYVARADIPLIPLSHDNPIRGTFVLHNDQGEKNGTMDVILKWTYSYLPPSASTRTPAQRSKSSAPSPREPLALLPDESVSGYKTIADKQKEMHVKLRPKDVLGSDSDSRPKPGRMEKEIFDLSSDFSLDLPRSSSGVPAPSVSRPGRDTRPRTSSNASTNKRGQWKKKIDSHHSIIFSTFQLVLTIQINTQQIHFIPTGFVLNQLNLHFQLYLLGSLDY